MTVATCKTTVQRFRAFEKKNGPSFIYGHLSAPYDGCFYLNIIAFVKGKYAYLATDLNSFQPYHRFVVTAPKEYAKVRELVPGCILARDLDQVIRPPFKDEVEFHPISELAENTPYGLYEQVINMAQAFGYDVSGQFRCQLCETDLSVEDQCLYLEGDYHGNGGIGIEVGAPVCAECFCLQHCNYCDANVEPKFQDVDDEGHCIYCAPNIKCSECGTEVYVGGFYKDEEVTAYKKGLCIDCAE